jgi:hypothetical protein
MEFFEGECVSDVILRVDCFKGILRNVKISLNLMRFMIKLKEKAIDFYDFRR